MESSSTICSSSKWGWMTSDITPLPPGTMATKRKSLHIKESLNVAHYINVLRDIQKEVDSDKARELEDLITYLVKRIPVPYIVKPSGIKDKFNYFCPSCGAELLPFEEDECVDCGQRVIKPEDFNQYRKGDYIT